MKKALNGATNRALEAYYLRNNFFYDLKSACTIAGIDLKTYRDSMRRLEEQERKRTDRSINQQNQPYGSRYE